MMAEKVVLLASFTAVLGMMIACGGDNE